MQATIPDRYRATFRRRSDSVAARATRDGSTEPFGAAKPRCLGELRLADLLKDGLIDNAQFEAERAALLARM